MTDMNTEKLANILRAMLSARIPTEFSPAATEPKEFGGHWFYVSHESGPEFSVAVMDRDSVASASMQCLQRFAELVGPVIAEPSVIEDLVGFEHLTDAQANEALELIQELGVGAK